RRASDGLDRSLPLALSATPLHPAWRASGERAVCAERVRLPVARLDLDELRVGEVAMRREETGMTGLQDQLLLVVGAEDGEVVGRDDAMSRHLVVEGAVRDDERDRITGAQAVDVGERRQVRGPVAGDVDEPVLS